MVVSGLHAPAALPPGKEPPVTIEEAAKCAPERVGTFWRTEKYLDFADIRPWNCQPAAKLLY
jgi:hypothetical protein